MFRLQSSVEVGTHQRQGSLQWLPCFFLVQSSFCGLRLRVKAACSLCKDSHLPRTQQSLGAVFLPSGLDGLHFAQRSESVRGFSTTLRMPDSRRRLTGRVRPFGRGHSSLREETFVSSRRDVCLFPKGRKLSTTGSPLESTSAKKVAVDGRVHGNLFLAVLLLI